MKSELTIKPEVQNNPPKRSKRKSDRGFTLIEILVAIFIFAIVLTTIFGSYQSVLSSVESIEEQTTSYEMAQNCLHRMILDLQSIHTAATAEYSPPDLDDPPDPYRIVGDASTAGGVDFSRLRFTSFAHTPIGKSDGFEIAEIAEIVYYVQSDGESNFLLKRSDCLYPYEPFEGKKSDPVLCEHVKSVIFKYLDQEGTEHESWDSDSDEFRYATPRAVRIQLEIEHGAGGPLFFETMITLPIYRNEMG